jgi:hypothetical protein
MNSLAVAKAILSSSIREDMEGVGGKGTKIK